jgi:hypothetical protein
MTPAICNVGAIVPFAASTVATAVGDGEAAGFAEPPEHPVTSNAQANALSN